MQNGYVGGVLDYLAWKELLNFEDGLEGSAEDIWEKLKFMVAVWLFDVKEI